MANINKKSLSIFVGRAIPDFIKTDHPRFYTFIETFFEFAERQFDLERPTIDQFQPGPYWIVENIIKSNDIDATYEKYLRYIHGEIAGEYPINSDGDFTPYEQGQHRQFLHMMIDFYRAKGTTQSYAYFFRSLFNTYFDYYLPKLDIIRCSDGKWNEPYLLGIVNTDDSPIANLGAVHLKLLDSFVEGVTSGATGYVDVIESEYVYSGLSTPNNDKYSEAFIENEEIFDTTVIHISAVATVYPIHDISAEVLSDVVVKINGVEQVYTTDYSLTTGPDEITFVTAPNIDSTVVISSRTKNNLAWLNIVSRKGEFEPGEVLNFKVMQEDGSLSETFISDYKLKNQSYDITDATYFIEAQNVGICRPPGYWLNQDGWLSSNKFLQNSYYYQDFSYVIRTDISLSDYLPALERNLHTAGFKLFSTVGEVAKVASPPDSIELSDNCFTLIDSNVVSFVMDNDVASTKYVIESTNVNFAGTDWSELDRFKTTTYNTYMSAMKDKDESSNDSGQWGLFYAEDFKRLDNNNHHFLFFKDFYKSDQWIDGANNHQFWNQFLEFDKTTSLNSVYAVKILQDRIYYNEYYTLEGDDTVVVIPIAQTLDVSTVESDVVVFKNGSKLPETSITSLVGNNLTLTDTFLEGDDLDIMILNPGSVTTELLVGENSRDLTYTPIRRATPLIFKDNLIVRNNEYVIEGSVITFNNPVSDLNNIEIIHINNQ